jgi:hypothetical protein
MDKLPMYIIIAIVTMIYTTYGIANGTIKVQNIECKRVN